jgi:hypothetical protein
VQLIEYIYYLDYLLCVLVGSVKRVVNSYWDKLMDLSGPGPMFPKWSLCKAVVV